MADSESPLPVSSHSMWSIRQPATSTHMNWHAATWETTSALASTSASFLIDKTPLTSSHHLPEYTPMAVSPTRRYCHELLLDEPQGGREQAYQVALQESYAQIDAYKSALIGTQATAVLQGMFIGRLSSQIQAQEDKQKRQKKGKLNADGLPKLLTGETFRKRVDEQAAATERDKAERENRRQRKDAQSELIAT